jgi:hypothetical protein
MISRFRFHLLALVSAAALSAGAPRALSQTGDLESHPASKVVRQYLGLLLARQYDKSAEMMDEKSLSVLQRDYVSRIKNAPTMDDEEQMVRRLHKENVEQIEKMKPRDFYTAYNMGVQEQHPVPPEALEKVKKSLVFKVLSVAQEDEKTVHVLVRTKHSNGKVNFESLDLISLLKNGDKWQVAPNQQVPKITPIEGGAGDSEPAAADPVKKPATADPVKPPANPKPPKRKNP